MSEESKNLEKIPESEINNEEEALAKQKAEEEEAARVAAEEALAKQKAEEEQLTVARQIENIEIKIKDVKDIIEEPAKIEVKQELHVPTTPSTPAPRIRNVARRRPKVGMIMRR